MKGVDTVEEFWDSSLLKCLEEVDTESVRNKLASYLKVNSKSLTFCESARQGIEKILLANDSQGKGVLISNYNCPVVLDSVSNADCTPIYYDIYENEIIVDVFSGLELDSVAAIVVPHFFGFRTKFKSIIEFCKLNGILIIEDCAHYFYPVCVSHDSDYLVYSFNYDKPISLLGGGAVVNRRSSVSAIDESGILSFSEGKHNFYQKLQSLKIRRMLLGYNNTYYFGRVLSKLLNGKIKGLYIQDPMSSYKLSLLYNVIDNYAEVCSNRRRNYFEVTGSLSNAYKWNESECAPIKYRLVLKDAKRRTEISQLLNSYNIRVGNFNWSSILMDSAGYPNSKYLSKNGIDIPIHQNLTKEHISLIRTVILKYES